MHCWVLLICVLKFYLQVWGESWWMVRLPSTLIAIQTKVGSSHAIHHTPKCEQRSNLIWILSIILVTSQGFPESALLLYNLYSIHYKFGWQNLLRRATNQIDNCFHIRLSPASLAPTGKLLLRLLTWLWWIHVTCHKQYPRFPSAWCHRSLKMKSFTSLSQAWFPQACFQKSLSEAHGPKWRLDCGSWRMMTHHLISMSPRHPLKYTAHPLSKDSSMDLLLPWYQATLHAQEISLKWFQNHWTSSFHHRKSLPISFWGDKDSPFAQSPGPATLAFTSTASGSSKPST